MDYRVELGRKIWKNGRKTHILAFSGDMYRYTLNMYRYILGSGHFGQHVPVQVRAVPVHVLFCFAILTSFRILTITCSFLIRLSDSSFWLK